MAENNKIYLGDYDSLVFDNVKSLEDYLSFREENDRWMVTSIDSMRVLACIDGDAEAFKAKNNVLIPVSEIEAHLSAGNKFFLEFQTEINGATRRGVVPIRHTAFRSILERAKISGFSLVNDIPDAVTLVLPDDKKAEIISTCLGLYHSSAKILYRDRKVSSVMSGQYAILGEAEIVRAAKETLEEEYSGVEFCGGNVSHEFFNIEYRLNAEEIEEDIAIALDASGNPAEEVEVRVGVFTSDIGSACATVCGSLLIDGKRIVFDKPQGVKHMGSKNCGDLRNATKKLYAMFQSNLEAIKALADTEINHPAGCLRLLSKEFRLPKKIAMDVATELESKNAFGKTTAYEIYFCLNEVVNRFEKETPDMMRVMQLQEAVAQTLKVDYKRFDKPFEWARGESAD